MKKIKFALISIVIIAMGFTSCTKSGTIALSEADKTAITKATTDINQAFNTTKDFKAYVNSYYAEDATVLYPNNDAVIGRDAILAAFSTLGGDINVTPTIVDINGRDDIAYVYGTVKMTTNAGIELDHGKYIEIWKRQKDGKWQVIYDMFNTSVPLAAEPVKMQ
jgi:ketosteroid isomerase-like protein